MFFKKKEEKKENKKPIKAKIKPLNYPEKILVAWGEAISGNAKIRDFLMKNGYEELGIFTYALRNEYKAQQWLIKNGYPHLAALIKAAEGDHKALKWLHDYKFDKLKFMALAIQGVKKAMDWLKQNDKFAAQLAHKMLLVKDHIEECNNSVHQINP